MASGGQYTLHFDSIKVCIVIRCLPIVLSDRVKCGSDWCCSAVSLKRPVFGARRKLAHRSRRIQREGMKREGQSSDRTSCEASIAQSG